MNRPAMKTGRPRWTRRSRPTPRPSPTRTACPTFPTPTSGWPGSNIDGATGSSHTLTASEQGQTIRVKVTFDDDSGNSETLTSAATVAVAAKPSPLTASTQDVPGSHDSNNSFTFKLRFSEEFGISYKTLRDHAFAVTGGEVMKARRLNPPSNAGWEITVQPSGTETVAIVLPITTSCDAQGAICTEDHRTLSNRLELSVAGPTG